LEPGMRKEETLRGVSKWRGWEGQHGVHVAAWRAGQTTHSELRPWWMQRFLHLVAGRKRTQSELAGSAFRKQTAAKVVFFRCHVLL
jgi:hypothetical protein